MQVEKFINTEEIVTSSMYERDNQNPQIRLIVIKSQTVLSF